MAWPAWTPGWGSELAPPVSALVLPRDGADGSAAFLPALPQERWGDGSERGQGAFSQSTQAPGKPRVDR